MFQIDLKNRKPIYEQVIDGFRQQIATGSLKEAEKVPSVRDTAKALGINPNTVQKAYRELENLGYFYTVMGQGNFVALPPEDARRQEVDALYCQAAKLIAQLLLRGQSKEEILKSLEAKINVAN
ncbi:MAG: GntR family transcriptional regulator [Defluviitaleaceae bacterium]|nr:GntR family transcriptional regulator [Defluviitaleaceae bacterium]